MIRVLVTGAAGQLGHDVVAVAESRGDTVMAVDQAELDITHREQVHEAIAEWRPDVVINCAAMTAVDLCESEVENAFAVNEHAVRWIAEACDAIDARLVHLSTDYVFDGTKVGAYVETDAPNPQSVYGASKLAGEKAALDLGANAVVVRTSWVCGANGSNMVRTVQRLVGEGKPLAFVSDQVGCPTFTADLAPALFRLVDDRRSGVYHLSNQGAVSWHGFVREIVRELGSAPDAVRAITTAELLPPRPAKRPANSVLENKAWRNAGYEPLRDFRAPLHELLHGLPRS